MKTVGAWDAVQQSQALEMQLENESDVETPVWPKHLLRHPRRIRHIPSPGLSSSSGKCPSDHLLDAEGHSRLDVQLVEQSLVLRELLAVGGDHLRELRAPLVEGAVLGEALGKHIERDLHGSGGARGGAEEAADGAICRRDNLGAELQDANLLRVLLHDLHALAGGHPRPVLWSRVRHELLQFRELLVVAGQQLLGQVDGQIQVLQASSRGRDQVVQADGLEEVEQGAGLQVPGAEAGERPEQQHVLPADDTLVQVRHGHGWRANGGLAVHLVRVLRHDLRILAHQEFATNREAHEAPDLWDLRLLQHEQSPAASANEDELGPHLGCLGAKIVLLDCQQPPSIRLLLQTRDGMEQQQVAALRHECLAHLPRQGTEVHIRADVGARQRDLVTRLPALHHERAPLLHLRIVLGVLHALEQRMLGEHCVALPDPVDLVLTLRERAVRRVVNELLRVLEEALVLQVGPVLAAELPLLVHHDGLGGIDGVALGRRVVGLAQGRVARASVVPAIGALLRNGAEALVHHNLPAGLQLLEHQAHGGAHDASTDQHYVDLLDRRLGLAEAEAATRRLGRRSVPVGHPSGRKLPVEAHARALVDDIIGGGGEEVVYVLAGRPRHGALWWKELDWLRWRLEPRP
mmetsp:Transcript_71143/g.183438  ORF Transcript_71143/g.183438 Transcript_71143/m.183438 type:complete len:633 (+) Transcript_71143:188-2086(+)